MLLGSFGLLATVDWARRPNGTSGVLVRLSLTIPGELLLGIVALGLASFVTWQLLIAIRDPEHRRDRKTRARRLVRVGHLFNGALYAVLVTQAMAILFGFRATAAGGATQKEWIARVLEVTLGRYLVGTVGIGIWLYGMFQSYRALTRNRDRRVDLTRTRLRPMLEILGVFGLLSRGVMFALIGVYLVLAAWRAQAKYAIGIAGALATLKQQPYGEWLLGTVTAGLVSYGLWQIAKEPYRRLRDS